MSARTPFHFGGQAKTTSAPGTTSNNGLTFIPNPTNALHRGSGQANPDSENMPLGLDANKPLPIAGLLGRGLNRTASHGSSDTKNLLQLAADLSRPQTTVPGNRAYRDSGPRAKQPLMPMNNGANIDSIRTPTPIHLAHEKSAVLGSPNTSFKTPALPSRVNESSPEPPLHLSGAHISNDIHQQRLPSGGPIRQQPSPDSSAQSGASDDLMPGDFSLNAPFRTSTPHGHGHADTSSGSSGFDASVIRPQRIFPQDYGNQEDYHHYYAQQRQQDMSSARKHSRERYTSTSDSDQAQPHKRPRNSHDSQIRIVLCLSLSCYR